MITNMLKKKLSLLLVWALAIGMIPVAGVIFGKSANAVASPPAGSPATAIPCGIVSETVHVAVYNSNTQNASCYEGGYIVPAGAPGDTVEVTVYAPTWSLISYSLFGGETDFAAVPQNEAGWKLPGVHVLPSEEARIDIGIRLPADEYQGLASVKLAGSLTWSRVDSDYDDFIVLGDAGSSDTERYDILIDAPDHAGNHVSLVGANGQPLSGLAAGMLRDDGLCEFRNVPIPLDGQIYVVMSEHADYAQSHTILIGYLPADSKVIKVTVDPSGESNAAFTVRFNRASPGYTVLFEHSNNMYALQEVDEYPDDLLFPDVDEIVLDVVRMSGGDSTSHLLTQFHYNSFESYERFFRYDIEPEGWRTVKLTAADETVTPQPSLAGVRVYEAERYLPFPMTYTYTDEQGVATFYPGFQGSGSEYDYEYMTVLPFGAMPFFEAGPEHRPRFIQTDVSTAAPPDWTAARQLKVTPLKRPDRVDPDPDFNLKDLVWFAQNMFAEEYDIILNTDQDSDHVVDESDLQLLLRQLAPVLFIPL